MKPFGFDPPGEWGARVCVCVVGRLKFWESALFSG